jgi:hypothetical protein
LSILSIIRAPVCDHLGPVAFTEVAMLSQCGSPSTALASLPFDLDCGGRGHCKTCLQ